MSLKKYINRKDALIILKHYYHEISPQELDFKDEDIQEKHIKFLVEEVHTIERLASVCPNVWETIDEYIQADLERDFEIGKEEFIKIY